MTKGIFIFVIGISIVMFGLNVGMNYIEAQPSPKDEKFVIVDTYKGCDVVRYTPTLSANYSYFLDCK